MDIIQNQQRYVYILQYTIVYYVKSNDLHYIMKVLAGCILWGMTFEIRKLDETYYFNVPKKGMKLQAMETKWV